MERRRICGVVPFLFLPYPAPCKGGRLRVAYIIYKEYARALLCVFFLQTIKIFSKFFQKSLKIVDKRGGGYYNGFNIYIIA